MIRSFSAKAQQVLCEGSCCPLLSRERTGKEVHSRVAVKKDVLAAQKCCSASSCQVSCSTDKSSVTHRHVKESLRLWKLAGPYESRAKLLRCSPLGALFE